MMRANDWNQGENIDLLMEIINLRINLNKLYSKTGPSSCNYISDSIKLDLLINEYFEEKTSNLTIKSKVASMEK